MKNTKGSINSFFPPWKYNGQTLGSIFLGLYYTTKEQNFAEVMAPAPSYWSKIEGGVWDLALSGVRQRTGDYAGVEPKHWMVCLTLLFPFLWTKNGKVAGLGQLGPQGLWGEQCSNVGCTEQCPVLLVALNSLSLDLELSKQPLKTGKKSNLGPTEIN